MSVIQYPPIGNAGLMTKFSGSCDLGSSPLRNAIMSEMSRSRSVSNMPCGEPVYSTRRTSLISAAAMRAVGSMGTVESAVPWIIKVGTLHAGKSLRKSVDENTSAALSVGRSPAYMVIFHAQSIAALLTGLVNQPIPKKSCRNVRMNAGRSAIMS